MKAISIDGQVRTSFGKKETNDLRKKGHVPCSVYGGKENLLFAAPKNAFRDLVYTPEFYTASIKVDGKEVTAVLQAIQFHPLTDEILHIDFRELHPDRKVVLELPVKLEGTPEGAKEGGKIFQRMKRLKVRLFPKDLVEHVTVKIDHLALGKSVRVGEIKLPGIEFLNAPHIPIISVLIPRQVVEEVPVVAAVEGESVEGATPVAGAETPAGEKGAEKGAEKGKEKGADKGAEKKEEKKK